ncbi:MAG: ScyD/ScyE family protein [Candidatus Promineofilum sp.]|nr:ScyD/ScyE family protein [Promineifilum sp.]
MQQNKKVTRYLLPAVALAALVALFLFSLTPTEAAPAHEDGATAAWQVIADGLASPRHLTFGPDGALYVAEAGVGGDGACVVGPDGGDLCFGDSGAVTKVTLDADMMPTDQTQIITGLPSLGNEAADDVTGPGAVAFDGTDMIVVTGLGNDPTVRDTGGALETVGGDLAQLLTTGPGDDFAAWVDLGDYERDENPAGNPLDTNPFDVERISGGYLVADAGGNSLLQVTDGGVISTVAVFPATMVEFPPGSGSMMPMEAVPTSVIVGPDGAYYVSQLTGFPFPPGGASVWRVEPGGEPEVYAGGFTNILDTAFAADGSLYVLEMFTHGMLSDDPTGAITRIGANGSRTVVAREGLIVPTGLTIGPDHALYVSNFGAGPAGQVVRIPTVLSEAADFAAFLNGGNEVSPVDTDASGVARFHLADDGTLSWEIAVRDIADITAAHIHLAPAGSNGSVIIPLYTGTGDFDTDHPLSGSIMLTPEQIGDLLAGNYYVNVHTALNPSGEMRGQIYPAHTWAFAAMLSGANEVPPVDSPATGQALMTLSADMSELNYRLMVNDLDGATAAHIHEAPAGSNGPVIFPLFTGGPPPLEAGSPVSDTLAPTISQVAALVAGDYYVNVHTPANPGGEIRGQVAMATSRADSHALLTGGEENPAVATDAVGLGTFHLSADLSTLDFHLAVSDIENVTAAHLHIGWPGMNGSVAHPLFLGGPPPLEPGSPVNGLIVLDAQSVLDLWSGYYYANVHTTANPGGEIRGQVEGASLFTADLSGANEVPSNGSQASGRAVLALSDDASTLYYRVMVNDIEHITASHIHKAPVGENGPVIFPLFLGSPPPFDVDNPISGILPLTDENLFDLIAGNYYVNVHTTHLPAGEIRGQVMADEVPAHLSAMLDGDQEVPPVTTDATGQGRFTFDRSTGTLHYYVAVADIDNVTASHIHQAPVGVNGPVIFPLYLGGGMFDPDHPIGGGLALRAENLVDLLTGYYYVNVHTTDHPSGEIRGQIAPVPVQTEWYSFMPIIAASE